ncbi:MAG TPA: hypothetical protein VJT08_15685 [Terriglobales bacterium]|nr:hypothetical protein [Terriglobales bacterium]
MQNRAIEIHDSEFDRITFEGADALLHFPHVYIHASEGRPAIDCGTGWSQRAELRIGSARVEGSFSAESREDGVNVLSNGHLIVNETVSNNLIPIPLDVHGNVELSLQCWSDVVHVVGNSAKLELLGEPTYIEESPGRDNKIE